VSKKVEVDRSPVSKMQGEGGAAVEYKIWWDGMQLSP
jgi:hypothetical protein